MGLGRATNGERHRQELKGSVRTAITIRGATGLRHAPVIPSLHISRIRAKVQQNSLSV